jgi:hypothetical protein
MRHEGDVWVRLSRTELNVMREAVDLTPNFEGRIVVRDVLRTAVRARSSGIALEREVAERFMRRLVAVDLPTLLVRTKLVFAIQDADRRAPDRPTAAEHPARAA